MNTPEPRPPSATHETVQALIRAAGDEGLQWADVVRRFHPRAAPRALKGGWAANPHHPTGKWPAEDILNDLLDSGVLYEPVLGTLKLVRDSNPEQKRPTM